MADQPRWLRNDAVALQLSEVGWTLPMLARAPDPDLVRRWFVTLCLFRHDPHLKAAFERDLMQHGAARGGPYTGWITSLKFQCTATPEEFPFCLNEKEFAFYSNKFFGGKIGDIEGIYKPPSFYSALGASLIKFGVGVVAGAFAIAAVPEEAGAGALSAPFLATAGGRAAISATVGAAADRLIPGGLTPESGRDRRLWPRYVADAQRRQLR